MDGNSLLSLTSNQEPPLMCEVSEAQQGSSGSGLGSPITACKKVLRSNSLLESTDYWLQNQTTPCQIGFVEDKSENCASVCFVNLDVSKDASSSEHLQQKLVNVSPDLPKLISTMNIQQPKENEIVLLSGLASGNLQADFEVSQCPWLPDICLVQCARGNRPNSTNCIIFEINKFLIGLELVQERQLHLETNILKLEDDTNCSLSSIEEDFLTASEHLEEESEVEECRNGYENLKVSVSGLESKKPKEVSLEEHDNNKENLLYALEEKSISQSSLPIKTEGCLEKVAENTGLQSLDPSTKPSQGKGEAVGNEQPVSNCYYSEHFKGQVENSQALCFPNDSSFSMMVKTDGPSAYGTVVTEQGSSLDPGDHEDPQNSLPPIQDGEATTGEYATNLAESVLQDAFIRLSQSQPIPAQESAVSVSVGSALLPSGCSTKDVVVPRSWDALPKIVIVQSPEGTDAAPEPGITSWPELEVSVEASGVHPGEKASRHPQSALEVALACAATVIGTISSPQATERFTMEQESLVANCAWGGHRALQGQASQEPRESSSGEYSFPSALCGMTQVASAVAVCGLSGKEEVTCPVTPSSLFSAAEGAEAIPPLGGLAVERSVELGKEAIAQALLHEAALVLTRPQTYSSIGELMESVNRSILESSSKAQTLCSESILRHELAQTLSDVILKHSIDEVQRKNKTIHPNDGIHSSQMPDTLMESANQLLHDVICFTFTKIYQIGQHGECPAALPNETIRWRETEPLSCQPFDQATGPSCSKDIEFASDRPLSNPHGTRLVTNDLMDLTQDKSGLFKNATVQSDLSRSHRVLDPSTAETSSREMYLEGMVGEDTKDTHQTPRLKKNERRASFQAETLPTVGECRSDSQETEDSVNAHPQEKFNCITPLNNEVQVHLSVSGEDSALSAQPMLQGKQAEAHCVTDFAEELAETVVSMATEIAAICLDNSNGKQPWFCAWKRGNEFLVTPNVCCRPSKRKKDSQGCNSSVRKHKPPRLSEIKRKTDQHPELKEKLMNRVVDESMNLEDIPDSVNVFANEVTAKIMNLTEFSMVDGVWQAQSYSRNRLLGSDRWNRLKASSCESIPEEDSEARAFVNSLGLTSTLSQPVSRASSVSKQSSCESITDEFSRFMVNQMENEGRGFELLLDYYAGKNASSILSSAMQQACRRNDHLSVRPSCPSKQSSTESITEEFYRYMLRDIERESKDSASSRRSSQDWTTGLLSPARSLLCYRQSSMPDGSSPCSRLTVNAPVKANSLDGFAQNCPRDFLSVQPVSGASSSSLCKSDSCLYRRVGSDHITNMLIHETWANSIETLMRKNKIFVDDAEAAEAGSVSGGAPLQVEKHANPTISSREHGGPALLVHEAVGCPRKDSVTESSHPPVSSPSTMALLAKDSDLDSTKETSLCGDAGLLNHTSRSLCSREVPLIQIETEQKEECLGEPECFLAESGPLEEAEEHSSQEEVPAVTRSGDTAMSTCQNHGRHRKTSCNSNVHVYVHSVPPEAKNTGNWIKRDSIDAGDVPEAEVSTTAKAPDEYPNPPSSSEDSTGSWSQLANEEDNPDDTSSFLQLSERSLSNGNSSATSSLGIMELDIYQENMPSSPMINELVEEKEILKEQSEHIKEQASGVAMRATDHQRSLLVINFDLQPECPDAELRATLQWIAASELGIPTIYFKKSQETRIEKFLDVVRLVHQKSWKVGDIFHAVVQYCKMHEEQKEGTPSLFDWLLELG